MKNWNKVLVYLYYIHQRYKFGRTEGIWVNLVNVTTDREVAKKPCSQATSSKVAPLDHITLNGLSSSVWVICVRTHRNPSCWTIVIIITTIWPVIVHLMMGLPWWFRDNVPTDTCMHESYIFTVIYFLQLGF